MKILENQSGKILSCGEETFDEAMKIGEIAG